MDPKTFIVPPEIIQQAFDSFHQQYREARQHERVVFVASVPSTWAAFEWKYLLTAWDREFLRVQRIAED